MLKAYQIAMYLFTLNMFVMLFAQMPLFGSAFTGQDFSSNFSSNMSKANFTYTFNATENAYYLAYDSDLIEAANFSGYQASSIDEFGIIEILVMFGKAVWNSTVYLPFFLNSVFSSVLPEPLLSILITVITGPVWFAYGAGVFQIIRGLIFED